MYETYWHLKQKPFENVADPRFYYPGESHQAALLKLRYAIENRRGGALLAGPSGTGKTLVATLLRGTLGANFAPFVHLVFPKMATAELLAYLADELDGANSAAATPDLRASTQRIERFLAANTKKGRHAVVVIDEAHLLHDADTTDGLNKITRGARLAAPKLEVGRSSAVLTFWTRWSARRILVWRHSVKVTKGYRVKVRAKQKKIRFK